MGNLTPFPVDGKITNSDEDTEGYLGELLHKP